MARHPRPLGISLEAASGVETVATSSRTGVGMRRVTPGLLSTSGCCCTGAGTWRGRWRRMSGRSSGVIPMRRSTLACCCTSPVISMVPRRRGDGLSSAGMRARRRTWVSCFSVAAIWRALWLPTPMRNGGPRPSPRGRDPKSHRWRRSSRIGVGMRRVTLGLLSTSGCCCTGAGTWRGRWRRMSGRSSGVIPMRRSTLACCCTSRVISMVPRRRGDGLSSAGMRARRRTWVSCFSVAAI